MKNVHSAPVRLDPAPMPIASHAWAHALDLDFEPALLTLPKEQPELVWRPQGLAPEVLRTVEHLAVRISGLEPDRFGILHRADEPDGRFTQVMRIGERWIVEVHDGTPQDWASRVYRGAPPAPGAELVPAELWSPLPAAEVMWSWMRGALPAGCTRRRVDEPH